MTSTLIAISETTNALFYSPVCQALMMVICLAILVWYVRET